MFTLVRLLQLLLTLGAWGLLSAGLPLGRPAGWQQGFGVPEGPNGPVWALVWHQGSLYVGGHFTAVGGVAARNVARWDGHRWHSLGTGNENEVWTNHANDPAAPDNETGVRALAVAPTGQVYVGGTFGQAGRTAVRNLARWDGRRWSAVGDFLHLEHAIRSHPPRAVVQEWVQEQRFSPDGYQLDHPPLSDNDRPHAVLSLAVTAEGTLYAGGDFDYAASAYPADTLESGVACWNGRAWQVPGRGVPGTVQALAVAPGGLVYAGGELRTDQPDVRGRVARWDGRTWTTIGAAESEFGPELGEGMPGMVYALAVGPGGTLYAGGESSGYDSTQAGNIVRWDGRAWHPLGGGPQRGTHGTIHALAVAGGRVYAAGDFQRQWQARDPERNSRVAVWEGGAWHSLDPARPTDPLVPLAQYSTVAALAVSSAGDLYAGGYLLEKRMPLVAHGLAHWSGQRWSYLPQADAPRVWMATCRPWRWPLTAGCTPAAPSSAPAARRPTAWPAGMVTPGSPCRRVAWPPTLAP